jgi:exodeoxyribonuclease VII large subunit
VREETYSVSQLCGEIRDFLAEAFPGVWVTGEVQRFRASRAGHLYLELVEKGRDDEIIGKLDAVVWRSTNRRIRSELERAGLELGDGQEVRFRGRVDFYPPAGRLQLIVDEVDPTFALGRLEMRRRETLEALRKGGLLELNKGQVLSPVPLDVALVTSEGSAAYHDFLSTLEESGFGFRVFFIHASVQGASAERELVSAIRAADALRVDCVALIRGGGARSDLAVFDSRGVAEAVATAKHPVLTGLGHQIDEAVSDLVAHRSVKTPTKAAEFLVDSVSSASDSMQRIAVSLRHSGLAHLRRGRELIGGAEKGFDLVGVRLGARRKELAYLAASIERSGRSRLTRAEEVRRALANRLAAATPRVLGRRGEQLAAAALRLQPIASRRLSTVRAAVESYRRLCDGLAPHRVLRRGFSITRDESGRTLRAADVPAGARITTTLAEGELTSRVEER